jgi:hypothetical protein
MFLLENEEPDAVHHIRCMEMSSFTHLRYALYSHTQHFSKLSQALISTQQTYRSYALFLWHGATYSTVKTLDFYSGDTQFGFISAYQSSWLWFCGVPLSLYVSTQYLQTGLNHPLPNPYKLTIHYLPTSFDSTERPFRTRSAFKYTKINLLSRQN